MQTQNPQKIIQATNLHGDETRCYHRITVAYSLLRITKKCYN